MTENNKTMLTGGCQCGAVRFALSKPPAKISICHCRMCQKASGAPFASFADIEKSDFAWTRGKPAYFQSSNRVKRGFCGSCGTPLSFEPEGGSIELSCGAFDNPNVVPPVIQLNIESKQPFYDGICSLPVRPDGAEAKQEAFKASIVSYQHPDHDTDAWLLGVRP